MHRRASWRREVEQKGRMADVFNAKCRIAYCRLGYFAKSRHSYNVSAYILHIMTLPLGLNCLAVMPDMWIFFFYGFFQPKILDFEHPHQIKTG